MIPPTLVIGFAGTAIAVTASTLYLCCTRARGRGAQLNNGAVQNCAPPVVPQTLVPANNPVVLPQAPPQQLVQPVAVVQPPPTITAIQNTQGTTGGGTRVIITGVNFTANVTVLFDNVAATVVNATAVQLDVDTPVHAAGAVDVRVTNSDGQSATTVRAFTYMNPEVQAITPREGPLLAGNRVRITGNYFGPNVSVLIAGRQALNVQRINEQTVDADVPARQAPTPIGQGLNVDVVNGHDHARGRFNAGYTYEPLQLTSVNPSTDTSAGGLPLTLKGKGFDAGTTVTIGGFPVGNLVVVSPTQIDCTAPALPAHGGVLCDVVAVSGGGGAQTATLADGFTYTAPVTLVAVAPARGDRNGNTQVRLLGMGFSTQSMVAFFGGQQVNTVFVDETERLVQTPNVVHPNGNAHALDVMVRDQQNNTSQLANGYTYEAAEPAMHVVLYPAGHDFDSILANGGNDPNLAGQLRQMHNTGALDARDGGAAVQVPNQTYHNHIAGGAGGLLFCRHTHPPHTIYQVLDVTLHRPDNNYTRNLLAHNTPNGMWHPNRGADLKTIEKHDTAMAQNFANVIAVQTAINNTFTLFAVEPNTGALANCDQVTIRGRNIPDNIAVTFGGVAAVCNSVDDTTVTATPPNHAAGAVDVRITETLHGRNIFVELPNAFTHQNFALAALTPAIGAHDGGNNVVITGTGFNATATVFFDATAATDVTVHSSTVISARAPAHAAGVVNVTVTVNGAAQVLPYRYVQ
ncbi:IPT/TIG domain-containing protein [Archangium minus]|uniref:IPT/TIG domain-containing protein n=1 Tax=Archangium minus TaxID=83450 RepID=UPI0037C02FB8